MTSLPPGMWRNSTMEALYEDDRSMDTSPCEVRVQGGELILSYVNAGRHCVYRGRDEGDGHYRLKAQGIDGRGTLHVVPGEDLLEGSWNEERTNGMWRIHLDE